MAHATKQHPNAQLTPKGRRRMVDLVIEGGWTIEVLGDPNAEPTAPKADPLSVAGHLAGSQVAAMRGDQDGVQAHVEGMHREFLQAGRIPNPKRPIDRESARSAVRGVEGVRSAVWLDRSNLIVMVDGATYRNQAMINLVCERLAPLGDTLAVVVNLQDVTATTTAATARWCASRSPRAARSA